MSKKSLTMCDQYRAKVPHPLKKGTNIFGVGKVVHYDDLTKEVIIKALKPVSIDKVLKCGCIPDYSDN